eukprot:1136859-Pelagomonas_calceolata.AAC.3
MERCLQPNQSIVNSKFSLWVKGVHGGSAADVFLLPLHYTRKYAQGWHVRPAKRGCSFAEGPRGQLAYIAGHALSYSFSNTTMSTFIFHNGYNGSDLQPGCLADRLAAGLSQPEINPQA